LAETAIVAFQGSAAIVFGASRKRCFYMFTPISMTQMYSLIASFIHGNALGVVLEPKHVEELPLQERSHAWQVRIGPLVPEAALGTEFPRADYEKVVQDLVVYCESHGIDRGIRHARPSKK
jgi:hypothetical protein